MQYIMLDIFKDSAEIDSHLNNIVEINTWLTIDYRERRAFVAAKGASKPDASSIYVNFPYEILINNVIPYFYNMQILDKSLPPFDPSTFVYGLVKGIYQIEATMRGILEKSKLAPYAYQLSNIQYFRTSALYTPEPNDIYPTDTYEIESYIKQEIISEEERQSKEYRIRQQRTFPLGKQSQIPEDLPLIEDINQVLFDMLDTVVRVGGKLSGNFSSIHDMDKEGQMFLSIRGGPSGLIKTIPDVSIWLPHQRYFNAFMISQFIRNIPTTKAEIIGKLTLLDPNSPVQERKWKLYDIEQITIIKEYEIQVIE